MRRFFLFLIFTLLLFRRSLPVTAEAEDKGEVKPVVTATAAIPNQEADYQLSISSVPRVEVAPGQEITYTIFYGCSGGNITPELRLELSWAFPEGEVGEYVAQSASEAYGGTPPSVELSENKISWRIKDFPPDTTSQKVSFKLRSKPDYEEGGTFPIEVTAHLFAPPFSKEASSLLTVTYLEEIPAVPLIVWRYFQEFFSQPVFRLLVSKLAFLFLILILLFAPLIILARLDIRFFFLPYLVFHFWQKLLQFFGFKKKPPVWGRIFAERTRLPLFLVKVSIYDFSGGFLGRCFTDREGKFGFDLSHGRYLLEVKKGGFVITASRRFVTLSGNDLIFKWEGKVGEIYLQKKRLLPAFWEETTERIALELSDFVLILGFLLGLANFCFFPTFLNAVLACFYFLFLSIWTVLVFR